LQVVQCQGGKALPPHQQSAKNVPIKADKQPSAVSRNDLGKVWILAPEKHHYTLQLGISSSLKAAQKFT
jgi:hypothetical protein